jgi:hypothetical protein
MTDQRRSGGLAESDTEFHARDSLNDGFVKVFDGLDKMGLPQNEVQVRGFLDLDGFQFHGKLQG